MIPPSCPARSTSMRSDTSGSPTSSGTEVRQPIYDPYPTYNPEITTNTAGFDLDGVAVLRAP